jgi:site-specific DNA-methyltransferase (adenine-specific)
MNKCLKTLPLGEIVPYENNPRHNDSAVSAVAESIRQCEYIAPIIVDENMVILAGHTRHMALKSLGKKEAEVMMVTGLTDEQKRKYRLLDNKTNELAEWDIDLLEVELDDLDFEGFDFGFDIEQVESEPEVEEDDYTEEDVETRCKLGDLWQLGDHRLICGDSTDVSVIDRLMDGVKADLYLTDPPYNVDYTDGHENERKIMNDHFDTDEQCGEQLWLPAFSNALLHSKDCCSVYCFMPQGGTHMMMMMMMMGKAGWQVKHELIWKKQSIVLNRADYNYQHEPFLYGWNKTHKFYGKGKFKNTSVWEFDRPTKSKEHPTMKPIELLAEILLNATERENLVLDTFGGSGSTLIACEQLNRKCYMCELDPHYCDVIIDRWEQFTGEKAVLINE